MTDACLKHNEKTTNGHWRGIGKIVNLYNHLLQPMIHNYIKIAIRALMRSKAHSAINIAGLSTGICCCILIGLFVKDELTFDRFHKDADRIYRVYAIEDWG